MTPEDFGTACAQAIEDKILEVGPENVAAFIGEPVQGAGGVIIPPANYWPQVEAICRKYGILLVCDEVICGFGRTGNWWGFETMGFEPDMGSNAQELEIYVKLGMKPMDAILTTTRNAAQALKQEKDLGTIEAGKLADVIAVDGDPLKNLGLFKDGGPHLSAIVKGGHFHKNAL